MKKQIRRGVFETNSSSVHSITLMMENDYDRWKNGGLYLCKNTGYGFSDEHKPKYNGLYTREECLELLKYDKYYSEDSIDWNDIEEVEEYLSEENFYSFDNFGDEDYEWDDAEITTPSGEKVICMCYYGYNG